MTIKDYLSKVSTVDTSKIELMCNKHNEPFMKYCVNCNIHYCSECENEKEYAVHSNEDHNAYFNQDYKEEDKKKIIEHGKEVIEKGNKYLTETLPAIRTKFSEASNTEIDDAYKTCIENNTQILHLIELIIKHFSFDSFHLVYYAILLPTCSSCFPQRKLYHSQCRGQHGGCSRFGPSTL